MSIIVKHFVVEPQAISALSRLEVSDEERQDLAETITLVYHQQLLNRFLEVLSEEDKKLFLKNYLGGEHEEAVRFLREKIEDIEEVVAQALAEIEGKIIEDIEELKEG